MASCSWAEVDYNVGGDGKRGGEVRELTALWEEGFLLDDRG